MRHGWYLLLCLVVPPAWGVLSVRLFDWWQSRRPPPDDADRPDMYHI